MHFVTQNMLKFHFLFVCVYTSEFNQISRLINLHLIYNNDIPFSREQ